MTRLLLLLAVVSAAACGSSPDGAAIVRGEGQGADVAPVPDAFEDPAATPGQEGSDDPAADPAPDPFARPEWLGTRVLPIDDATGFGTVVPTPPELDPRELRTPDHLPRPSSDAFASSVTEVPADVVARSTWSEGCPVTLGELRYVTVTFWGFDGEHHTGELLIHRDHAEAVAGVFAELHAIRWPIEEMRITEAFELDLPPTGDGNNTSAFVCRAIRGGTSFSQHAYGLAVDVNPFHNPYRKGEVVLPELASTYADRADVRPGMLTADGPVVAAFAAIGWEWGGAWTNPIDTMHFSATGR